MMYRVVKRDGKVVDFKIEKISAAIEKAFEAQGRNYVPGVIDFLALKVTSDFEPKIKDDLIAVEDIQDSVESVLSQSGYGDVAKAYITYRYEHAKLRNASSTDGKILSIVDNVNETVIQENSNKNPAILSTQRDYIAGEVSRDISTRLLLPPEIAKAHEEGIIHFHDADYYVQRMHNCCLVNLEDMLQNGTVINGTLVEKPHSFATACNVATQIMAQVASCQ